ncbi:protein kish-B isoform X1 [Leuresthes tenuis]|uniref:protein kish-B isoform X1 n=1 Tax=Leuresthes tenuis TaxID=355514 RepID=UPI003B51297C
MTNVYSFDGILVFGLLFICTCAYLKKVPRLNNWLLSEKKGVWGVFYKVADLQFSSLMQSLILSCHNWNEASHCHGIFLRGHGVLHCILEMIL